MKKQQPKGNRQYIQVTFQLRPEEIALLDKWAKQETSKAAEQGLSRVSRTTIVRNLIHQKRIEIEEAGG